MSQRKARLKAFGTRHAKVEEYIKLYMYSLRALINYLSPGTYDINIPKIATIGTAEIWPCVDGAVVLVYSSLANKIKIVVRDPLSRTVNDFLINGEACAFYDEKGHKSQVQTIIQLEDSSKSIIHLADNVILGSDGRTFRTRYDRAAIFGWDAALPNPDEEALRDFKAAFVPRNIAGVEAENLPQKKKGELTKTKADALMSEYSRLLDESDKEEELQKFLTSHPEFIYPDFITCYPKFKLGEDYITDYVLLVQGHNGPEYVFVEIERPGKEIFVKSGQFSAPFTEAKDQLLNWDSWLTKNHAYVSNKLPNLYKPQFHLIIGRDLGLSKEQKEKIQSEFSSTTRRFSTYDDLANRFKTIVDHLLQHA